MKNSNNKFVVGISECCISDDPNSEIITHALGSCMGMTVYDPELKIGGMIHCLLPLSRTNPQKAQENPYMFVDVGVPLFLNEFFAKGANKHRIEVKLSGCGKFFEEDSNFDIGKRNHTVVRKILWKNDILITSELIGGNQAKTMSLDLSTGVVLVTTPVESKEI